MSNNIEQLTAVLGEAIKAELAGNAFFLMAGQTATDPRAKEVFEQFAADEMVHARTLRALYESAVNAGRLDPDVKLPQMALVPDAANPIFSPGFKARLGDAHFEVTALSIGIQLEQDSMAFYRKHAQQTDEPVIRDLFNDLYEWEKTHYRALSTQLDAIKEDYWHENKFTPF